MMTERDIKVIALRMSKIAGWLEDFFRGSIRGGSLSVDWRLPDVGRVEVWIPLDPEGEIWLRPRLDDSEDDEDRELGKVVYVVPIHDLDGMTWADLIMELPDEYEEWR